MNAGDDVEALVRARAEGGAHGAAVTALVEGYGPEIVRYLAAVMRASDDDLAEVFAMFCEDVVRGLPRFRFGSSVRTWSYTVARHALSRFTRGNRRRGRRITLPAQLDDVAAEIRTRTVSYLRTEVKDRLAQAREQLGPDAREILALRVDRQLGWREIAQILADEELDDDGLRRREQALRKRFETIKRQLKAALAA